MMVRLDLQMFCLPSRSIVFVRFWEHFCFWNSLESNIYRSAFCKQACHTVLDTARAVRSVSEKLEQALLTFRVVVVPMRPTSFSHLHSQSDGSHKSGNSCPSFYLFILTPLIDEVSLPCYAHRDTLSVVSPAGGFHSIFPSIAAVLLLVVLLF